MCSEVSIGLKRFADWGILSHSSLEVDLAGGVTGVHLFISISIVSYGTKHIAKCLEFHCSLFHSLAERRTPCISG